MWHSSHLRRKNLLADLFPRTAVKPYRIVQTRSPKRAHPFALGAVAQPPNSDCANATLLCAQQPVADDNTGAVGLPGFCPGTANLLWYTFTTNSQGGPVDVTLSGIDCPVVPGMDDELTVVVLAGNGSCAPASFNAVSLCGTSNSLFTTTTNALAPSTQYWVPTRWWSW